MNQKNADKEYIINNNSISQYTNAYKKSQQIFGCPPGIEVYEEFHCALLQSLLVKIEKQTLFLLQLMCRRAFSNGRSAQRTFLCNAIQRFLS